MFQISAFQTVATLQTTSLLGFSDQQNGWLFLGVGVVALLGSVIVKISANCVPDVWTLMQGKVLLVLGLVAGLDYTEGRSSNPTLSTFLFLTSAVLISLGVTYCSVTIPSIFSKLFR